MAFLNKLLLDDIISNILNLDFTKPYTQIVIRGHSQIMLRSGGEGRACVTGESCAYVLPEGVI